MVGASFLPDLPHSDIQRAIEAITQIYDPTNSKLSPGDVKALQTELFDIQKRPEAWGLIIPLFNHENPNVQFFGAHTVQVKIARDWSSFPQDCVVSLRDLLLQLTVHALVSGKLNIITRKLFVSLCSLALKTVPYDPLRWPNWIAHCVGILSGAGVRSDAILDFLAIVAEEVHSADLLGTRRDNMRRTCKEATELVLRAITATVDRATPSTTEIEVNSALKCFQAWLPLFDSDATASIVPFIYPLLDPERDTFFLAASTVLQELLDSSTLFTEKSQAGTKHLTQPILVWLDAKGTIIVEKTLQSGIVDEVSHSTCKLISALGDHSTAYLCQNIVDSSIPSLLPQYAKILPSTGKSNGQLVQNYLRVMLEYTGLPGYFGIDEETSEITNTFWYLFQEELWESNWSEGVHNYTADPNSVVKSVYVELVRVLQRKCKYPPDGHGWPPDQVDRFQAYRRDIGDTLINAYYVIRDDMLVYFIDTVIQDIATQRSTNGGWEAVESTLHCINAVEEALDNDNNPHLPRLFNPDIIRSLPSTGQGRIRMTTLNLLGSYASWFALAIPTDTVSVSPKVDMLMSAVGYAVAALPEPTLSVQAALALRDLCDANRKLLAPQINAFAELYAGLAQVPDSEKSKVLQSIASVIEALPPAEQVAPIEIMTMPIVQKLMQVLNNPILLPDDARNMVILHLESLAGLAKGLTRASDDLLDLEDDVREQIILHSIKAAREDERMVRLRDTILAAISRCVEVVGQDHGVGQAINELVKSITALPADITIMSLPSTPLLGLVCSALQRQITAAWLALSTTLFSQMKPPQPLPLVGDATEERCKREQEMVRQHDEEVAKAKVVVREALSMFLSVTLPFFSSSPTIMTDNPDVVQEFFNCLDTITMDFIELFYELPDGALDAVVQCAIQAMTLQERYSLTAACTFLSRFVTRSYHKSTLETHRQHFTGRYGKAIMRASLSGLAEILPQSTTPNLIDLLSVLLVRCVTEAQGWLKDIMFEDNFISLKMNAADKEKFLKAVIGTKASKKIREAANEFALVARGLEGTSFGYATISK